MKTEILAPVGNQEALEAAIAAGCDAVYFALPVFGARAFAKNFTLEETKEIIERCHLLDIKVYITMNTILFEDEIEEAYQLAKKLHEFNVDALIVQDLGFMHLLHHRLPNLTLHASTQLSISKPEMIEKLKMLGVKRVVLARECTLEEIQACIDTGMEIEVFVHGALCICYSGQCTFSAFQYDRSGNRGQCAQPCRMPYELYMDDKKVSSQSYLLSPKDLSLIDQVKTFESMGVISLKIEGRMKSPTYVYESVFQVKKVLENQKRTNQDKKDLMIAFNRGYTKGHAYNCKGYDLMNPKTSNHQGIVIGKVLYQKAKRVYIQLSEDLYQNDGIRFGLEGCYVNFLYDSKGKLTNFMPAGSVCSIETNLKVHKNIPVLKTISVSLDEGVEKNIHSRLRQCGITAHISCEGVGYPLVCDLYDGKIHVQVSSENLASQAMKRPTDESVLRKQFNKTKDSWAYFTSITFDLANDVFFTISDMNELRRLSIDALKEEKLKASKIVENEYLYQPKYTCTTSNLVEVLNPQSKLDSSWVCELDGSKGNVTSVSGVVVSNLGDSKIMDGMNITNSYGVAALLEMGYESVVLSDECSDESISMLTNAFRNRYGFHAPVYKTLYQKRRLMVMNHCVINTCLKDGQRKNCSLCHSHTFKLKGKDFKEYYLVGDRDCHMRIYDSETVDLTSKIRYYNSLGMSHFKLCFFDENSQEMKSILSRLQA